MECCGVFGVSLTVINKNLKDYGIKKDNNSRRKNIEKTFVKKYGSKSCFGSDKVRNKCKETMLKKYGVSYTAQSVDLQKKMQNTMNERYGKKNYVGVKYGVTWPCQIDKCVKALEDAVGHSKPEQMFEKILKDNDIKFEREFPIRGFKYDFKVGNILFEINPTGTHNVNFGLFGKPAKNKMYHYTGTV